MLKIIHIKQNNDFLNNFLLFGNDLSEVDIYFELILYNTVAVSFILLAIDKYGIQNVRFIKHNNPHINHCNQRDIFHIPLTHVVEIKSYESGYISPFPYKVSIMQVRFVSVHRNYHYWSIYI